MFRLKSWKEENLAALILSEDLLSDVRFWNDLYAEIPSL